MSTTQQPALSVTESAILAAIQAGNTRAGQISKATGLSNDLLDAPLKKLRRAGFANFVKGSGPGTGWQPGTPATGAEAERDSASDNGKLPELDTAVATVEAAAKSVATKRAAKNKAAKSDSVVYVWDGEKWNVRELAAGEVAKTLAKELTEMGMHSVAGKLSIGAPEGPPEGWQPEVETTTEDVEAAKQKLIERFDARVANVEGSPDELPPEELAKVIDIATAKKPSKAKKVAPPPAESEAGESAAMDAVAASEGEAEAAVPADFLLFVGSNFYDMDAFVAEAAELGISRRMPSHRLPSALVCGVSKVYIAAGGARKAGEGEEAVSSSKVFGYFVPQRVEFIASTDGGDGAQYADIIASVKARPDARVLYTTQGEAERGCGTRKEGGTYIVVDKADSPLHLLKPEATYEGNHFRGMMKLDPEAAKTFASGGTVTTLVDEVCMVEGCGRAFKCAPDGHARAMRERRRMEKGEEPKWRLACGECRRKAMAAKAAERRANKVAVVEDGGAVDMEALSSASMDGEGEGLEQFQGDN